MKVPSLPWSSAALHLMLVAGTVSVGLPTIASAQVAEPRIVTRGEYTLVFHRNSSELDPAYADRLVEGFFRIYPQLVTTFNPRAPRTVVVHIDEDYKGIGIAQATGNVLRFKRSRLQQEDGDFGIFTHELMHVVQTHRPEVPSWLSEGIADYARAKYGPYDERDRPRLFIPLPDNSYTDGYAYTARFLIWLEENRHPGLAVKLEQASNDGTYDETTWSRLTGQSVDESWAAYTRADGWEVAQAAANHPTPEQLAALKAQLARIEADVAAGRVRGVSEEWLAETRARVATMEANVARNAAPAP